MKLVASVFALLALLALASGQGLSGGDPADETSCDVSIIGGGPSGIYTAYRLLETNETMQVCLFEATGRLGGRIYSVRNLGPNKDLVLDMGAYRYMPLTQPIITSMIENNLQLPNRLYQPGIPDYKVVLTPDGSNAGFQTWVVALAEKAVDMGLELNYNTKIVKLFPQADGSFTLLTASGRNITSGDVILNLPSRPLHRLLQNSGLPTKTTNQALYETYQIRATKLYLYYENTWWLNAGLNNGSLAYNLPWNTTQPPVVPIIGRYHDGHVKCQSMSPSGTVMTSSIGQPMYQDYYYLNTNSINNMSCYGYIQALYTSDSGTTNISHYPLDYMVDYSSPTPGTDGIALPYTVWDNTTATGMKLLTDAHTQMMAYQSSVGEAINGAMLPTQAIVALWDPSVDWSGGAWHSNKTNRAGEDTWSELIIKPFPESNLFIADEAYGTQFGWAEGGLTMAENIVRNYFGALTPYWMTPATASAIAYGPGFSDYEDVQQGGGTGQVQAPSMNGVSASSAASGLAPSPQNY